MNRTSEELSPQVSEWLKNLSDNLAYLRHQQHLTQSEMAEQLRVKRAAVSMFESGLRIPSLPTYLRGIEFLEKNPGILFTKVLSEVESSPLSPLYLPGQLPLFAYDTYVDTAEWIGAQASQLEVKIRAPCDYPCTLALFPPQSVDFVCVQLGLEINKTERLRGKPISAYYLASSAEGAKLLALRWRSTN